MNWTLRMTAVVVLAGMVAALPGVQALTLTPGAPPLGCHSHTRTPLSPVSYQCCANGHNWAMVASPLAMPLPVVVHSQVESGLLSFLSSPFEIVAFISSSPPQDLPLRI